MIVYSDSFKQEVLEYKKTHNYTITSNQFNIPSNTIRSWLDPEFANRKKQWGKECYHKNKKTRKAYILSHKDKILADLHQYGKVYRRQNKDKIYAYQKQWKTNKYRTDPIYQTMSRVRSRIYKGLKGHSKSAKTQELIGCTFEQLKVYLESNFPENMSWQNYSEWHIDHIRPISSFNLLDPEQQRQCFHYTNLQPLWMEDNLAKRDKW